MAQEIVTNVVGEVYGKAKEEIGYMWNWSKTVEDLKEENKNLTLMRRRILQKIKAAKENGDTLLDGVEKWVGEAESRINEAKEIIEGAKAESSHISEAKKDIANKTCFNLAQEVPPVEKATTPEVTLEPYVEKEVAAMGPKMNKRCRKRGAEETEANAPAKVLRKDHASQSSRGGKSLAAMGLDESRIPEEVTDGAQVGSHISEAKEYIDWVKGIANKACFKLGMRVNPVTCYSYGKKAANMACSLKTVREDGKPFESCVSVPTRRPGILDLYEKKKIDDFKTHKLCFNRIMKSIKDDSVQIIGIYGIGGVGKITLAKEVVVEVKSLFAAVEFITVSQPVDVKRIKKEVETAAKRIIKGEKILVILDDVWEEVKLDEVGIPCGNSFKNCKILLTSRSEDVCESMNATRLISVVTLPTKEAWILFKSVVGDTVEKDKKLKTIAEKIVEGCGGLPLILKVVGATLKNESIESWQRALRQLKKHKMPNVDRKIRLAYSHLQLSYDFLENEDAKSCFLLCSMFPEDYDIPLESLAYYGVGLKKFKDFDSMEEARDRVRSAVKILKYTCLLLDGDDESTVKMHDVVREVALLIASKGGNEFLVKARIGLKEWQPRTDAVKSCKGISLMHNHIEKLPDYELEVQFLDIFLLQGNDLSVIPDKFIQGVKEARVLDFGQNEIESLPPSMKQLTKLCVLNLGGNKSLCDISILGELKLLEILILNRTGIAKIPHEIGNLVKLRRLEVKGCRLSHIAPSVFSKLLWLEELHLEYYGAEDENSEGLIEIGKLSKLTFLDLFVPHVHLIPKGVCFKKLKGFVIQIGGYSQIYEAAEVVHKKTLILGMDDLDTASMLGVKELIKLSDGIIYSVENANNLVPRMYCESMDGLTTIMLLGCYNLSSLADSSDREVHEELGGENTKKQLFSKLEHLVLYRLIKLKVLWKWPDEYIGLMNLVTLDIARCDNLERLISINVARGLVNLQTLTIYCCDNLKEVIWDGDEGGHNERVVFQRLVKIELCRLKSLERFYGGEVEISYPALEKVVIDGHIVTADEWRKINGKTTRVKSLLSSTRHFAIPYSKRINQVVGVEEWQVFKKPDRAFGTRVQDN